MPLAPKRPLRTLALACLLAASCSTSTTSIKGEDTDVVIPGVRASWNLLPRMTPKDPEAKKPRGVLHAEVDVAYGDGSSSQTLAAGQSVSFEGLTLNGPAEVSANYSLLTSSVAVRGGVRLGQQVTATGLMGFSYMQLDMRVSSGGLSDSASSEDLGLLLGAQLDYEPTSWLVLSGRVAHTFTPQDEHTKLRDRELGARFRIWEHGGLFAGWRGWDYYDEHSGSDFDLALSGPTIALHLGF
jgi:hypothetical protein